MTRGFTEPARAVPLRWGRYGDRYAAGLALIIAGLVGVQGGNANFGLPLGVGALAHAIGWWILPAGGWRRAWAVLPALAGTFVLLIGPAGIGIVVLPFAGWLLVRNRPAIAYLTCVPVLGIGVALRSVFAEYDGMLPALAIMAVVVVAAAWFARGIAAIRQKPSIDLHLPNKIEDAGRDARP